MIPLHPLGQPSLGQPSLGQPSLGQPSLGQPWRLPVRRNGRNIRRAEIQRPSRDGQPLTSLPIRRGDRKGRPSGSRARWERFIPA